MISPVRVFGLAIAATALLGGGAQAQSVAIANGSSLTWGSATYTISGCAFELAGATSTCSAANAVLAVDGGTTGTPTVIVESATSGQALMSLATGQGSSVFDDLSFVLTVSTTTSKTLSSFSTSIAGSDTVTSTGQASTAYLQDVTTGATLSLPSGVSTTVTPSAAQIGTVPPAISLSLDGSTSATASFSPAFNPAAGNLSSDLQVQVDLKVKSGQSAPGDTISLTSVTYTAAVPEPMSMAVLATGMLGLAGVRRRMRRG